MSLCIFLIIIILSLSDKERIKDKLWFIVKFNSKTIRLLSLQGHGEDKKRILLQGLGKRARTFVILLRTKTSASFNAKLTIVAGCYVGQSLGRGISYEVKGFSLFLWYLRDVFFFYIAWPIALFLYGFCVDINYMRTLAFELCNFLLHLKQKGYNDLRNKDI